MLFEELKDDDPRLDPEHELAIEHGFVELEEDEEETVMAEMEGRREMAMAVTPSRMDSLKFDIQDDVPAGTRIKVIGVGGGGCDAAGRMYQDGVSGVEFYAINTDRQALAASPIPNKLLIGHKVTGGLGAGADPNVGKEAALEDTERIIEILEGADMVFVAAGMGGGTGTGAAPVVASLAKELNALTVAIVTKPFAFEGARRGRVADKGIDDLAATVDTLIQIPNERLTTLMPKGTSLLDSFRATDDVLRQAVVGISDIMNTPGLINRDFADIRAIMQGMGYAVMGTASARGEGAAMEAAKKAIHCPMLEGDEIKGARGVLINITASSSISLHDVHEACSLIRAASENEDVQVNFGIVLDETRKDEVKVTVIATGFRKQGKPEESVEAQPNRVGYFSPPLLAAPMSGLQPDPIPLHSSSSSSVIDVEAGDGGSRMTMAAAASASGGNGHANGGSVAGYSSSAVADEVAPRVQDEVDVPAFLRRDRKWFS
jgi:cell division protein FtsZ